MRSVATAIATALAQPVLEPWLAIELGFDAGYLRLWTGIGDRTIDGQTYLGVGTILSIGGLEEVADLSARQVSVQFQGIDRAITAIALSSPYQRRPARILFGVMGEIGHVVVWAGQMNRMTTVDDGERVSVTLELDSRLVELQRSRVRLYTEASQKARDPSDTFFDWTAKLIDQDVVWGRPIQ